MKVEFDFMFGNVSKEGYRHFPVLYLTHGTNGFILCVAGIHMTVKWGKSESIKDNSST